MTCKEAYYPPRLVRGEQSTGVAGIAVDTEGRIYASTRAGVQMFDPTGRLSGVLAKPATPALGPITFGGPEGTTLYVACGDKVFARKTKAKGVFPSQKAKQ